MGLQRRLLIVMQPLVAAEAAHQIDVQMALRPGRLVGRGIEHDCLRGLRLRWLVAGAAALVAAAAMMASAGISITAMPTRGRRGGVRAEAMRKG